MCFYGLTKDNEKILGGYLLNDENFREDLLIEKKAYGTTSELSNDNKFYDMVNNISNIPFKINTDLLNYITGEGEKHNLLLNPYTKHKFSDLNKKTKYKSNILCSYNSKIILQETIRDLARYFQNFN